MKTKDVVIVGADGRVVCKGALADNPLTRMRGLLGRDSLPPGEGLLISPTPSIHTFFMRFAIDAVFLDRDHRVVSVVPQLHPWRTASRRKARAVLELAAGEAQRRGVVPGERLQVIAGAPA
jgi:uncharacterized membrane protein (UPF0127 family)